MTIGQAFSLGSNSSCLDCIRLEVSGQAPMTDLLILHVADEGGLGGRAVLAQAAVGLP